MKGLTKEYNLPIETYYIWEIVAECLVVEPWTEEEVKKSHEERDKQYERDDIDLLPKILSDALIFPAKRRCFSLEP